jgi:hypothetical protein
VSKVHVFVHAFADVVAELVDLLANISQEGVAPPAANHELTLLFVVNPQ